MAAPNTMMPGGVVSKTEMDARDLMLSCPVKTGIAVVGGFGVGAAFGIFMASMDVGMPGIPGMPLTPGQQAMEQSVGLKATAKEMAKQVGTRSWATAKNFAIVGGIFAATECALESYRGKHDIYNIVATGCITGGVLGLRAGPKAAVAGCAGFAMFSSFIEMYMGSR